MASNISIPAQGMITQIQRFSLDDGPGIRTTVFLKGCSLNCIWCHNPECIQSDVQIKFSAHLCTNCAACVEACPENALKIVDGQRAYYRESCTGCGKCLAACDTNALEKIGKKITCEEIVQEIIKDRVFYETSGGGVTVSGGEALLQPDFTQSILLRCKALNLHTAIDTAGNVPWKHFEQVIPYTDLVLYDLKCIDPARHAAMTGSDNHLIMENLKQLLQEDIETWIRIPLIPGLNDREQDLNEFSIALSSMERVPRVQLIPYHRLGIGKYAGLGLEYQLADTIPALPEEIKNIADLFTAQGIQVEY